MFSFGYNKTEEEKQKLNTKKFTKSLRNALQSAIYRNNNNVYKIITQVKKTTDNYIIVNGKLDQNKNLIIDNKIYKLGSYVLIDEDNKKMLFKIIGFEKSGFFGGNKTMRVGGLFQKVKIILDKRIGTLLNTDTTIRFLETNDLNKATEEFKKYGRPLKEDSRNLLNQPPSIVPAPVVNGPAPVVNGPAPVVNQNQPSSIVPTQVVNQEPPNTTQSQKLSKEVNRAEMIKNTDINNPDVNITKVSNSIMRINKILSKPDLEVRISTASDTASDTYTYNYDMYGNLQGQTNSQVTYPQQSPNFDILNMTDDDEIKRFIDSFVKKLCDNNIENKENIKKVTYIIKLLNKSLENIKDCKKSEQSKKSYDILSEIIKTILVKILEKENSQNPPR